jgi:hypothetical protein
LTHWRQWVRRSGELTRPHKVWRRLDWMVARVAFRRVPWRRLDLGAGLLLQDRQRLLRFLVVRPMDRTRQGRAAAARPVVRAAAVGKGADRAAAGNRRVGGAAVGKRELVRMHEALAAAAAAVAEFPGPLEA